MKFNQLQKLLEAFSQWKYKIPADKEDMLFDFYVLTMLPVPFDEKLDIALDDAQKTILTESKRSMLSAVFFAICAEARHMFKNNKGINIIKLFTDNNLEDFILLYHKPYIIPVGPKSGYAPEELFTEGTRSYQDSYKAVRNALDKTGTTREQFISVMAKAFLDLRWTSLHGGKPWSNICSGWLRLNDAASRGDLIVAIDHVYDLQHNTDTVFNKVKSYYKDGHDWLRVALDKKRNVVSLWDLYDNASVQVRPFMAAVLKNAKNETLEMWMDKAKAAKINIGSSVLSQVKDTGSSHKTSAWFTDNLDAGNILISEDAVYTMNNGILIWETGTWEFGTWKGGIWKQGIWEDGTWKGGTWEKGDWYGGTWEDGTWEGGEWEGGTWENGLWKGGIWSHWHDGTWEYGTWEDGTWEYGTWEKGTWIDGTWENGWWYDGTWKGGTWESGDWYNGLIYDPNKKGKEEYVETLEWDGDYVKATEGISPAIYFGQPKSPYK